MTIVRQFVDKAIQVVNISKKKYAVCEVLARRQELLNQFQQGKYVGPCI